MGLWDVYKHPTRPIKRKKEKGPFKMMATPALRIFKVIWGPTPRPIFLSTPVRCTCNIIIIRVGVMKLTFSQRSNSTQHCIIHGHHNGHFLWSFVIILLILLATHSCVNVGHFCKTENFPPGPSLLLLSFPPGPSLLPPGPSLLPHGPSL